jgi:hypothetical protein
MITVVVLNIILWVFIEGNSIQVVFSGNNWGFYVIALIITVLVSTVLHAIGFFKEAQRERKINESLREEKLKTELNALKAHIDPHFLFNSFNVLSGLIDENPERAQKFLAQLSSIYRYILESRQQHTNALEDELNFAKTYLELLKARFEDSIILDLAIKEEDLKKQIPALSLQLLLENAVKHNRFDRNNPLRISISQENGHLVVYNNRSDKIKMNDKRGMGLSNIEDRYKLLGDQTIEIHKEKDSFIVKLPLLS